MSNPTKLADLFDLPTREIVEAPVPVGARWPVIRTGHRPLINRTVRRLIYDRDNWRCFSCERPHRLLELDHIIPWSAGGPDSSDNLRSACHDCNTNRSNYRTERDYLADPVTLACDGCITGWIRIHGYTRYGRCIPDAPRITAYCGECAGLSFVTDPRRLQ